MYNLGLINSFFLSNEFLVSMLQSRYVLHLIKIKLVTQMTFIDFIIIHMKVRMAVTTVIKLFIFEFNGYNFMVNKFVHKFSISLKSSHHKIHNNTWFWNSFITLFHSQWTNFIPYECSILCKKVPWTLWNFESCKELFTLPSPLHMLPWI